MSLFLLIIALLPTLSDEQAIETRLLSQQASWNKGDFDGYMEPYWNSEELKFVTKDGVTMGWQATIDRYKRRYPDKAAMGELTFEVLHNQKLSEDHRLMIGQWRLKRKAGDLQGHFSLVWKKIDGQWYIIADHSS